MKRYTFLLIAVAAMAGIVAFNGLAPRHASGQSAPAFVTEMPHGYRDWRWVSSAHEAGNLNSIGAVLVNDVAIKAYRDGKLPFPDGTMIVALHYRYVPSDENNRVFGLAQSFVPGAPYEHSVYDQGLKEVRCHRWMGVRSLRRRQTWRRGVYEKLLSLPPRRPRETDLVSLIAMHLAVFLRLLTRLLVIGLVLPYVAQSISLHRIWPRQRPEHVV